MLVCIIQAAACSKFFDSKHFFSLRMKGKEREEDKNHYMPCILYWLKTKKNVWSSKKRFIIVCYNMSLCRWGKGEHWGGFLCKNHGSNLLHGRKKQQIIINNIIAMFSSFCKTIIFVQKISWQLKVYNTTDWDINFSLVKYFACKFSRSLIFVTRL